ncbi:hypothetical protein Gogos_002296, partial [Gossypium gossypioides]|nr:hypothetical protein [Gossypium gossypioides]
EICFIVFSLTSKTYVFGHPFVESIAKNFLNPNQPFYETIHTPVEAHRKSHGRKTHHWWETLIDQLNLRELYERDECFAELINLLYVTRDKKIATISSMYTPMDKDVLSSFLLDISSMYAPMDEDVLSSFPLRYYPNHQQF